MRAGRRRVECRASGAVRPIAPPPACRCSATAEPTSRGLQNATATSREHGGHKWHGPRCPAIPHCSSHTVRGTYHAALDAHVRLRPRQRCSTKRASSRQRGFSGLSLDLRQRRGRRCRRRRGARRQRREPVSAVVGTSAAYQLFVRPAVVPTAHHLPNSTPPLNPPHLCCICGVREGMNGLCLRMTCESE